MTSSHSPDTLRGSSPCRRERASHSRSRSRSPPPRRRRDDNDRPKASTGGFRWKDKSKDIDRYDRQEDRHLDRGYRERDVRQRGYERDRDRDRRASYRNEDEGRRERGYENRYGDRDRDDKRRRDEQRGRSDQYHDDRKSRPNNDSPSDPPPPQRPDRTEKKKIDKPPRPPKIAPTSSPLIIVNVNDRLGTKAAVPCLASDSIGDFKKIVAARIGREPHEIMLKRQGERPFKDMLTLEDYGVGNGVQLDLEVDTGD
ncbi:MAG: hypothetical protein Q9220_003182 [cf. Caloplaca sp. 1 TL-2023]